MPVFNDWEAAVALCGHLERELSGRSERFEILLINDGSTVPAPAWPARADGFPVSVLELTRNLGHQRAIAVALAYIHARVAADAVVVMDGDGEDRPQDVPRLIDALHSTGAGRVVFAQRRRRVEGMVFRTGYLIYRALHRLVTGFSVQVGNFSVIPIRAVSSLVVSSELWAHYAASVYAIRLPVHLVPADRGARLAGRSKMDYVQLVTHGLGALSVFRNRVGARLLLAVTALCLLLTTGVGLFVLSARQAGTSVPIATVVLLLLVTADIGITGFGIALAMFAERQDLGCLPGRDYPLFVRNVTTLHEPRAISLSGR